MKDFRPGIQKWLKTILCTVVKKDLKFQSDQELFQLCVVCFSYHLSVKRM